MKKDGKYSTKIQRGCGVNFCREHEPSSSLSVSARWQLDFERIQLSIFITCALRAVIVDAVCRASEATSAVASPPPSKPLLHRRGCRKKEERAGRNETRPFTPVAADMRSADSWTSDSGAADDFIPQRARAHTHIHTRIRTLTMRKPIGIKTIIIQQSARHLISRPTTRRRPSFDAVPDAPGQCQKRPHSRGRCCTLLLFACVCVFSPSSGRTKADLSPW